MTRRVIALLVAAALVASGCSGPILANPPLVLPSPEVPSPPPTHAPDPVAISLPRDDGPHDRLTEWWYYTGHLRATDDRRFGFEAVVFRAERGSVPAAWASHLALTEEGPRGPGEPFGGGDVSFHYAQRSEVGPQVDHSPRDSAGRPVGFDLQVGGLSPLLIAEGAPPVAAPWRLAGANGTDRIEAALSPEEAAAAGASFGLQLDLETTKPPAMHDGDGYVDFGPAGSSYYYSRTRMAASGTLQLDGEQLSVDGIAWFDHQWGDFVSVGGGGWDWFAINLDDGVDLTISIVRNAVGRTTIQYGTVVDADGTARALGPGAFEVTPLRSWVSARSGHTYVVGWHISVPTGLPGGYREIVLAPTLIDQELDTRATTGVAYWEGSQQVTVTFGEQVVEIAGGEAYVEMTRYDAGSPP